MNEGKISCEDGLEVVKAFEDTLAAMQSKFPRRDLVVEVCEREKSRWIAGLISVYDKSIREVMDSVHIENMGFGLRGLSFALCKQIIQGYVKSICNSRKHHNYTSIPNFVNRLSKIMASSGTPRSRIFSFSSSSSARDSLSS